MILKEKELTAVAAVFMLLFIVVGYLYLTVPVPKTCNCSVNDTEIIRTVVVSNERGYADFTDSTEAWVDALIMRGTKRDLVLYVASWEVLEHKLHKVTKVIKTSEDKK